MSNDQNNPFNITREEILELAAQKIADSLFDQDELSNLSEREIRKRIQERVYPKVDEALTKEMEHVLSAQISPVNIWGERTGETTTIRAALHQRAKDFWNVNVNGEGKETSYGGSPRSEWMFGKIVKEEFSKAVSANMAEMVKALKSAVNENAQKSLQEQINKLFTSR